jgi:hypothetical protein
MTSSVAIGANYHGNVVTALNYFGNCSSTKGFGIVRMSYNHKDVFVGNQRDMAHWFIVGIQGKATLLSR